jgi:hypothetical protein
MYRQSSAEGAGMGSRRQKVLSEGPEALLQRIAIVTGKGRGKDDEGGSAAREAVAAILTAYASPFQARPSSHSACDLIPKATCQNHHVLI